MAQVWNPQQWNQLEAEARRAVLRAGDESAARDVVVKLGRRVLRAYSTSFFIVTRFLPPARRARVNTIYAAVRYPDEIVDSFDLPAERSAGMLADWRAQFGRAMGLNGIQAAVRAGVHPILAGFAQVCREAAIPADYYHAFLDAMAEDITPRRYATLGDLIEGYIYGSATVVGYFLCHVYGEAEPGDFPRAMAASRDLGIALQLTNFLRDVGEDQGRGRLYLPLDMLARHGAGPDSMPRSALQGVMRELAEEAAARYGRARVNLDAFAPDCRMAIEACVRVYSELNDRVADGRRALARRESVPLRRKLQVLPASKFWRLPMAFLGLEPA